MAGRQQKRLSCKSVLYIIPASAPAPEKDWEGGEKELSHLRGRHLHANYQRRRKGKYGRKMAAVSPSAALQAPMDLLDALGSWRCPTTPSEDEMSGGRSPLPPHQPQP
ncbi:hypothetical protein ZWY2020_025491 [Hordeum vulgare]|nr:hypothetical protein ZWY2020_025491 [Hordeum vulgare]